MATSVSIDVNTDPVLLFHGKGTVMIFAAGALKIGGPDVTFTTGTQVVLPVILKLDGEDSIYGISNGGITVQVFNCK